MPPVFFDLELEPWTSGEQAGSSASRAFQQEEAGPSSQRTVHPETLLHRRREHPINGAQADANRPQPSKRKQPNVESSPPDQSSSKKPKILSETELGIIKLAAGILDVPLSSLLAAQTESQAHSEGSSTTYDSLETPSTGQEQADGYDIPVEPTVQPSRHQHPAPTSAPTFQPQVGGYDGNINGGYQNLHTFRNDLDANSKNHLEWWGLNPGLFDDFQASSSAGQPSNPPIRQEAPSQPNDWGHGRFEEANVTAAPGPSSQPAWGFAPQGPTNGYHGPFQAHSIPTEPMQHTAPFGPQPPPPGRQAFAPFNYGARSRTEARTANISPAIIELDDNLDILGTTFGTQEIRPLATNQARVGENHNQAYPLKRPRQPRRANNGGDGRKPGRRGPLTEEQRLETSLTRKKGACIRCQRQAIKVS